MLDSKQTAPFLIEAGQEPGEQGPRTDEAQPSPSEAVQAGQREIAAACQTHRGPTLSPVVCILCNEAVALFGNTFNESNWRYDSLLWHSTLSANVHLGCLQRLMRDTHALTNIDFGPLMQRLGLDTPPVGLRKQQPNHPAFNYCKQRIGEPHD